MEYQKIINLINLNQPSNFRTMLKSSLCDYSYANILVKKTKTVNNTAAAGANSNNKKVIFQNCAAFINCISEINSTQVDNSKDIDIVMPMYKLFKNIWKCVAIL